MIEIVHMFCASPCRFAFSVSSCFALPKHYLGCTRMETRKLPKKIQKYAVDNSLQGEAVKEQMLFFCKRTFDSTGVIADLPHSMIVEV